MFILVASEKVLQGILCMNELSLLVTCTVLMSCLPKVCTICSSMIWMYNPSTFVFVTYVVCMNFFITGQKRLSGNVRPRDVRESVDATLEIDLTGIFCLVLESVLNGLNGLERIVPGTLIEIPILTLE